MIRKSYQNTLDFRPFFRSFFDVTFAFFEGADFGINSTVFRSQIRRYFRLFFGLTFGGNFGRLALPFRIRTCILRIETIRGVLDCAGPIGCVLAYSARTGALNDD